MKKAFLFFISLAAIALSSCETTYSFHYENSGSPDYSYIYSMGSTSFPYSFSYSYSLPSTSSYNLYPNARIIQDNKATRLYDYILDGNTYENFTFFLQNYGELPFYVSNRYVYDHDYRTICRADAAYVYDITGDGYADFFYVSSYTNSDTFESKYGVTIYDYVRDSVILEMYEPDRFHYLLNLSGNNFYINRNKTGEYGDSTFGRGLLRYAFTNRFDITWEKRFNITNFNYSVKYGRDGFVESPGSTGINSDNATVYADNNSMYVIDIKFSDLGSSASLPNDEPYQYNGGIVSFLHSKNYYGSLIINYLGKTSDSYRYYFYFHNAVGNFDVDVSLGGVVKRISFNVGAPTTTTTLHTVFKNALQGSLTIIRTADYFLRDASMAAYDMMYTRDLPSGYRTDFTSYLKSVTAYKIDPSFASLILEPDLCYGYRISTSAEAVVFRVFDEHFLICGETYYYIKEPLDTSLFNSSSSICFDYSIGQVSFIALKTEYQNYIRSGIAEFRMTVRANTYTNYSIVDAKYVFSLPHMTYYLIDATTFANENFSRVYTVTSGTTFELHSNTSI